MADDLELVVPNPVSERTATAWLVYRTVELLNAPDDAKGSGYAHAVELLRERRDAVDTVFELLRSAAMEDVSLRWSALHVAGDVGDESAADLLLRAALAPLPERKGEDGCETTRDGELLIRSVAVDALRRVAMRHAAATDHLLRLVAEHPARPVLIEAVKAAAALKLTNKVAELLPEDDRWMLEIRTVAIGEVTADPERLTDVEPASTPPGFGSTRSSPTAGCRDGMKA